MEAAAIPHEHHGPPPAHHSSRVEAPLLGMLLFIISEVMIFGAFFTAYFFIRVVTHDAWPAHGTKVPEAVAGINTLILLVSSLTMELARRKAARQAALAPLTSIPGISLGDEKHFPWLGITVVLGFAFLVGQGLAWGELHNRGFFLSTNPSSSFAFLLTIAHAVHLTGGMIALLCAGSASLLHKPIEARRIAVDITAWYWHFMAVLWIYIFALLGFAR